MLTVYMFLVGKIFLGEKMTFGSCFYKLPKTEAVLENKHEITNYVVELITMNGLMDYRVGYSLSKT